MIEEKLLASAIYSRDAFSALLAAEVDHDLSDKAGTIWNVIKEYYGNDPEAPNVDVDLLKSAIERKYPKHADNLISIVENFEVISVPNIINEIIELKKQATRFRLSAACAAGNEQEITVLMEQYDKYKQSILDPTSQQEKEHEVLRDYDVGALVEHTNSDNRIKVLPRVLNDHLDGGVLRQHHIVIFAPTDMGKSLFALNMAYGFIKQGLVVLYVGNEDPGRDMLLRFLQRITGMTRQEIREQPQKAKKIAEERGYHNFIFVEASPGSEKELRELIEEYKPDVVMVDQIRNLNMHESNRVLQLEKAATMMRNIGKQYNILPISLTQAADSATGKAKLDRGDIDYSNVGIPGQADLLIGIGATTDMEDNGIRLISFVKNKISGDKTPLRVSFNPFLTKVQ